METTEWWCPGPLLQSVFIASIQQLCELSCLHLTVENKTNKVIQWKIIKMFQLNNILSFFFLSCFSQWPHWIPFMPLLKLVNAKKENLKKAYDDLLTHPSLLCMFPISWSQLMTHFILVHNKRLLYGFVELQVTELWILFFGGKHWSTSQLCFSS